jgi:hypothetical protein
MRAQRTDETALSRFGQHAAFGSDAVPPQIDLDGAERQLDSLVRTPGNEIISAGAVTLSKDDREKPELAVIFKRLRRLLATCSSPWP